MQNIHQYRIVVGCSSEMRTELRHVQMAFANFNKWHAIDKSVEFVLYMDRLSLQEPSEISLLDALSRCDAAIFILDNKRYKNKSKTVDIRDEISAAYNLLQSGRLSDIAILVDKTFDEFGRYSNIAEGFGPISYTRFDTLSGLVENVNVFLHKRLDDLKPPINVLPEQESRGLVFGGLEDQPIVLIDPIGDGLVDNPDQRQCYDDIKDKLINLIDACRSSNRLASLNQYSTKLLTAMGPSLKELRVRAFWAQMNSLRRRIEADDRLLKSSDPEDPPLAPLIASQLHDLVDTLNVFAAYEPKFIELDEFTTDPSRRVTSDALLEAAKTIAAGSANVPKIVTSSASSSLVEAALEAAGDDAPSERAKQFHVRSSRNL